MTRRLERFRDERGFALIFTFLLLVLLLTLAAASLTMSSLDLRSTTHYGTGNQALTTAEAGFVHALSTMNTRGVQSFQLDIVNNWSALWGSGAKAMPNYPQYTYTATVAANVADPNNQGTITVIGTAPSQAQRTIQVRVVRSGVGGAPGALYLASPVLNSSTFNGNSFNVDGNDHTITDALNPSGTTEPGISTQNDAVTSQLTSSLNSSQKNNITGLGYSSNPLTPSVMATGGPSVSDLNTISNSILAKGGVVTSDVSTFNNGTSTTFGTTSLPQITHLTASSVQINGNITGAGVLIIDGDATISGTIDFVGLIIVKQNTTISSKVTDDVTVQGTASIVGSLWTGDLNITIGGHANIDYSQAALNLVDTIGGGPGNLTRPMQVQYASWQEL